MSVNRTIWVFPVSDNVSNESIKNEFSGSGKVLRIDRSDRGFCHVTFSNHQEAEHAIRTKNRDFFQGRFIKVQAAIIEEKDVQDKVDRARTNWQAFCLKNFVCENWNIYDCENAVPGGCCYNGHHFCLYCLAMGNGHQPHRNTDPSCPSRRQGWQEFKRFKSARERELAERRPGLDDQQQRQVEAITASGGDRGTQALASGGDRGTQDLTRGGDRGTQDPTRGGDRVTQDLTSGGDRGSQALTNESATAGNGNHQTRPSQESQSSQPKDIINSVATMRSQQRGGSSAGGISNSMGADSRTNNKQPISSLQSNNSGANNTSSIRETGPNKMRFKAMAVEANVWLSVVLSSCERGPKDFNVHLTSSKKQLADLMNAINQKDLLRPLNPLEITDGKPCLAISGSDGIIYRAMVLDYAQQQANVYFLDYGKVENLNFDKLFNISDELIQQPALSLRCRLNNWPKYNESNKALAKERLKHYENRHLKCKVLNGKIIELRDEGDNDVANEIQIWINTRNGPEQTATREKLKELLLNKKVAHKAVGSPTTTDAKKPRLTSEDENRSNVNGSGMRIVFPYRMYQKFSPRSKRNTFTLCAPRMNNAGDIPSRVSQKSNMFMNSFGGNCSNKALLCVKTVQLSIPTNKVDAVIGPNGARLQQIRKESMTSITVGASGDEIIITIKGNFKGVQTAQAMIKQGLLEK